MNNNLFQPCNILFPRTDSFEKWSVIACDQFTAEPAYWEEVKSIVGDHKSTLNLILPEAFLKQDNTGATQQIHASMQEYLAGNCFEEMKNAYVYVERTLQNGMIRPGIVGLVDLEAYSFDKGTKTGIRPTEKTVVERIPPRKAVRQNAPLELPHIILFYNDAKDRFTAALQEMKKQTKPLYDFDLIMGGGHITGWLLNGEKACAITDLFTAYQNDAINQCSRQGLEPMILAVGDGNHSLATAKSCWEDIKQQLPADRWESHPSRYAMVEIENIYDPSQEFEPIHRIVQETDTKDLLAYLQETICCEGGFPITWQTGTETGTLSLNVKADELPLAVFQDALDKYLADHAGEVDYIHGEQSLLNLAQQEGSIGFLMPDIDKSHFFTDIMQTGVLPRKTFSIGHAQEKRYYLEARRIL